MLKSFLFQQKGGWCVNRSTQHGQYLCWFETRVEHDPRSLYSFQKSSHTWTAPVKQSGLSTPDEIDMISLSSLTFWISPEKLIYEKLFFTQKTHGHIPYWPSSFKAMSLPAIWVRFTHYFLNLISTPARFWRAEINCFHDPLSPSSYKDPDAIYLVLFYYKWNITCLMGTKQHMISQIQD